MNIRFQAMIAATAMAVVLTSPAQAQDQSPSDKDSDIIVTARRYEERLQDVPISVTVYSQEQLANRNIVTPADLATYTPSLTINGRYGPEKSSFVIRGFVQEPSTSPSVGVYFADVVAPRAQRSTTSGNGAIAGQLFDLQNVQVLKGPQGTLFGRNTTGGAVLFVPQKPTGRFEGYVEGSAGDYGMWRGQGVLNIPLSDSLKVRLGVDRNKRDGYMRNQSGVGPKSFNDLNYFAARASILANITPDIENYTIGTYTHSFSRGFAPRIGLCLTNAMAPTGYALSSGQARTAGAACAQIARAQARGDGPLDVDIGNPNAFLDIKQWQVTNTTTWNVSNTLTVKNIISYAEFRENSDFNLNGDNFSITNPPPAGVASSFIGLPFVQTELGPTPGENNASQSGFVEELQLQGRTADSRLVWQAGGYLEVSHPIGWSSGYNPGFANCTSVAQLACITPFAGIGSVTLLHTKTYWNNKAIYAQATYKLTDQLSFTGGIRYTWDRVLGVGESRRLFLATTPTGTTRLACNDTRITASAADPANCHREYPQESNRPTWLLDVDFKPTPDILLYAKWARGYRQGGVNLTNVGIETWGPEKVDTYEIGAKATFHSGQVRGYLNAAAFYNDFTSQQLVATLLPRPGTGLPGAAAVINAGKSKIQGFELEGSLTALARVRLDLGYTYLDTELKSIVLPDLTNTPFQSVTPSALAGQPLALSPKHRLTATLTYTLPLAERMGNLSIGATYTYTSNQYATRADDFIPFTLIGGTSVTSVPSTTLFGFNPGLLPATNLLNLNVNWNGVLGSPVDAAFFMTNVTNKIYPVNVGSSPGSAGFENFIYGAPRMWGFRLRYKIGS